MEVDKALDFNMQKDFNEKQVFDLTKKINEKLESWIKEYPHQWFWVHNRWKK
jgi:KDO2-lipid IV(A) lauroyltransferase